MTPDQARDALRNALHGELPEERAPRYPAWPYGWHRAAKEARAAHAAAVTRREHLQRLIDLPDGTLVLLLRGGWNPHDRH